MAQHGAEWIIEYQDIILNWHPIRTSHLRWYGSRLHDWNIDQPMSKWNPMRASRLMFCLRWAAHIRGTKGEVPVYIYEDIPNVIDQPMRIRNVFTNEVVPVDGLMT